MLILGDCLIGYLKLDQILIVYIQECEIVKCLYEKELDCWIDLVWGYDFNCCFDCCIIILIYNECGMLVCIVVEIGEFDVNIVLVVMDDEGGNVLMKYLCFIIQVEDCVYLVCLMCGICKIDSVVCILCECG